MSPNLRAPIRDATDARINLAVWLFCVACTSACTPPLEDPSPHSPPSPHELHVLEVDEPDREWLCEEGWSDGRSTCYQAYVDLAMQYLPPDIDLSACRDEQSALVEEVANGSVFIDPLLPPSSSELAAEIVDVLQFDAWASDIDTRTLEVFRVDESPASWGSTRTLQFADPLLGNNEVLELWPDVEHPPVLIALPGHPDGTHAAQEMIDGLQVAAYVEAGYAVLVLDTQAYDTGNAEHLAAASMLCAGRPMMAVRAYEFLVLHKYVRYLQATDRAGPGVGLLSHSGGSVAANMISRFVDSFDAVATDLKSNYLGLNSCSEAGPSGTCVLDEASVALHRLSEAINDDSVLPFSVPTYETDYGYPEGSQPVIDFFDTHLSR